MNQIGQAGLLQLCQFCSVELQNFSCQIFGVLLYLIQQSSSPKQYLISCLKKKKKKLKFLDLGMPLGNIRLFETILDKCQLLTRVASFCTLIHENTVIIEVLQRFLISYFTVNCLKTVYQSDFTMRITPFLSMRFFPSWQKARCAHKNPLKCYH